MRSQPTPTEDFALRKYARLAAHRCADAVAAFKHVLDDAGRPELAQAQHTAQMAIEALRAAEAAVQASLKAYVDDNHQQ